MKDLLKKTLYTGIGAALLTKEKIETTVKEMIEKGKMNQKDGNEFVDEIAKHSEEAMTNFQSKIEENVTKVLKKMNLVTAKEFKTLQDKLDALLAQNEKNKSE